MKNSFLSPSELLFTKTKERVTRQ